MKNLLLFLILIFIIGCGSKYVKVETLTFTVNLKQLYKKNGVLIIYYLEDEFTGHKLTDKKDEIEISEESSLNRPVLIITEKASTNELRGTKNVLKMTYNLVLPSNYVIKEK